MYDVNIKLDYIPSECDLCGHDALSLDHEQTVGTLTVPPATVPLVPFQTGHHTVVATSGTLGRPQQATGRLAALVHRLS